MFALISHSSLFLALLSMLILLLALLSSLPICRVTNVFSNQKRVATLTSYMENIVPGDRTDNPAKDGL